METFSTLLALCAGNFPVTGEFPAQMQVTRNFDILFDLRLKKRLSKQSRLSKAPCHWSEGIFKKSSEGIDQKTGFIYLEIASWFSRGQWIKVALNTPDIETVTEAAPLSPVELGFIN